MALIDKLNRVANDVDDRKSYSKYVRTVLKAHGFTMKSAGVQMGFSQPYIGHAISYDPILKVAIIVYQLAMFINVPPRELLYPLNSGLNTSVPYTYQGWKNQYINKVHDRKTLMNSLHVLLGLNSYNVSQAMDKIGHPNNYLSFAIGRDSRTGVNSLLHGLAPLIRLSDDDCSKLVKNSGVSNVTRISSPGARKRFIRLMTYLRVMTNLHRDTISGNARRHESTTSTVRTLLSNIAKDKHVSDNEIILKKIFPYLDKLDEVRDNSKVILDIIQQYGHKVRDRRMLSNYITALLKYRHIPISKFCRSFGYNQSYLYSAIEKKPMSDLFRLCQALAKATQVDFNSLKKVAKLSGTAHGRSGDVLVRRIVKGGTSMHLNVPQCLHMKPNAKFVVIKRHDGSLLYEPIKVYKEHKNNQSRDNN